MLSWCERGLAWRAQVQRGTKEVGLEGEALKHTHCLYSLSLSVVNHINLPPKGSECDT